MASQQEKNDFTEDDLLKDLFFAYRKAKADLYYEENKRLSDLADYEEKLDENLEELKDAICAWLNDPKAAQKFFAQESFIGTYYFVPVGHVPPQLERNDEPEFLAHTPSDKWEEWMGNRDENDRISCKNSCNDQIEDGQQHEDNDGSGNESPQVTIEHRIFSKASINMHVLSALWIWYVGDALDQQLSDGVFANRLRRNREGDYNKWSTGNFKPYTNGYKQWRNGAIREAEKLLDTEDQALIFNTDITSFYPRLDPSFLKEEKVTNLWKSWNPKRSRTQESTEPPRSLDPRRGLERLRETVNDILIFALEEWSKMVWRGLVQISPPEREVESCDIGLPLGLPASGLIANVAMHFFDLEVEEQVKPAFYGRYVDDIFIVMRGDRKLNRGGKVWDWLAKRINCLEKPSESEECQKHDQACFMEKKTAYSFQPEYLKNSVVEFRLDKTRIHFLHGVTGRQVLGSIEKEIEQNASEWRELPEELDMTRLGSIRLMMTVDEEGQAARALNKARSLTASRTEFAAHLRNMSILAETCELSTWANQRSAFFQQAAELFAAPHMYAEFERYYVRVLQLAVKTGDQVGVELLLDALQQTVAALRAVETRKTDGESDGVIGDTVVCRVKSVLKGFERLEIESEAGQLYQDHLQKMIDDAMACLAPTSRSAALRREVKAQVEFILKGEPIRHHAMDNQSVPALDQAFLRFFGMDLSDIPFKQWLSPNTADLRCIRRLSEKYGQEILLENCIPLLGTQGDVADDVPQLIEDAHFYALSSLFLSSAIHVSQRKPSTREKHLRVREGTALEALWVISESATGGAKDHAIQDFRGQMEQLYRFAGRVRALALPTRPMDFAELTLATEPHCSKIVWDAITKTLQKADAAVLKDTPAMLEASGQRIVRAWTIVTQGVQELEFGRILNDPYYQDRYRSGTKEESVSSILRIPNKDLPNPKNGTVTIALPSLETTNQQFRRSVMQSPDLSYERFVSLTKIVNDVARLTASKPDYLVLPELSVPKEWFLRFAQTLNEVGINFVAGVEYIHHANNQVSNEWWAALILRDSQRNIPVVTRHQKSAPAVHEEENLRNLGDISLTPRSSASDSEDEHPKVIEHGGFHFAVLICSELTDITYRSRLRGKIDALFVLEWNQDLNSFDALVNAAALDLHSYVVQVNNRQYGDSRIRAPHSKTHERDLIRIRGGLHNHFVVGNIDIQALQQCHSVKKEPDSKFKPLPAGFRSNMAQSRFRAFEK